MTIEEKIDRFKELGGFITIKRGFFNTKGHISEYNEIFLDPYMEEKEVSKLFDTMIKSLEEKPWLKYIEDMDKQLVKSTGTFGSSAI